MLKIKKKYIGQTFQLQTKVGWVTFDPFITNESEYQWFKDNGLDIFDEDKPILLVSNKTITKGGK